MTNGFHSHYCPRCKADKECAQITHCRREPTSLCADCFYEDLMKQNAAKIHPQQEQEGK